MDDGRNDLLAAIRNPLNQLKKTSSVKPMEQQDAGADDLMTAIRNARRDQLNKTSALHRQRSKQEEKEDAQNTLAAVLAQQMASLRSAVGRNDSDCEDDDDDYWDDDF